MCAYFINRKTIAHNADKRLNLKQQGKSTMLIDGNERCNKSGNHKSAWTRALCAISYHSPTHKSVRLQRQMGAVCSAEYTQIPFPKITRKRVENPISAALANGTGGAPTYFASALQNRRCSVKSKVTFPF